METIITAPEAQFTRSRIRMMEAAVVTAPGKVRVGWIGRNRMEAIADGGAAEVAAIADSSQEFAAALDAIYEHSGGKTAS